MQTRFTDAQLADPVIADANDILRSCVHCGFCIATCPTYVVTGDELDSPRGRIYLIKEMLEEAGASPDAMPRAKTVQHIDNCLSCLSCMTTCPASVNYMHLVDLARTHIEETTERPASDRWLRTLIAETVAYPTRFRVAMIAARIMAPVARRLPGRLGAMAALADGPISGKIGAFFGRRIRPGRIYAARGPRRARMALAIGCAQQVLAPQINEATVRVLTRHGIEIITVPGAVCCGSLDHHMGRASAARRHAGAAITAWDNECRADGLDAIVVNTSGCGTTIKDYGFIYRNDAELAAPAARVADLTRDISEVLAGLDLEFDAAGRHQGTAIAYHGHCSLQHGQGITRQPADLMRAAGFKVSLPTDAHLCCGSAGSYSLLQPQMAASLRDAKAAALQAGTPDVVVTGNIGCMSHLAPVLDAPIVHLAEIIDWATGGPRPVHIPTPSQISLPAQTR
ncbi:MAG: glycolate oxidase subunit GlcF [Alphaproteobacteria bacterium]|nr:glycolate oxidase subunit GlcF [Alphaproteobacteria bacterium]